MGLRLKQTEEVNPRVIYISLIYIFFFSAFCGASIDHETLFNIDQKPVSHDKVIEKLGRLKREASFSIFLKAIFLIF